jgi:hypothetical protein
MYISFTSRNKVTLHVITLITLVSISISAGSLELQAQQSLFTDKQQTVSFTFSDQFQIADVALAEVLVALKIKEGGFPSFNIVSIAQSFSPKEISTPQYQERILADYRRVGYTDAVAKESFTGVIAHQKVLTAEIHYPSNLGTLIALVTLLPNGPNSHLVLTYIDSETSFSQNKPLYDQIINSLTLLRINNASDLENTDLRDTDLGNIKGESSNSLTSYWTTFAILVLLGFAIVLVGWMRRARSRIP